MISLPVLVDLGGFLNTPFVVHTIWMPSRVDSSIAQHRNCMLIDIYET